MIPPSLSKITDTSEEREGRGDVGRDFEFTSLLWLKTEISFFLLIECVFETEETVDACHAAKGTAAESTDWSPF